MSYPRVLQWVPRITKKSYMLQKTLFWDNAYCMPKYCQRCNFRRRCKLYCSKLRPLNSNLRACIAHHKGLYSTLGPSSTTQRPLTSIRRFCTAPRVALENTIGPSGAIKRPINSTPKAFIAPLVAPENIIGPHTTIERPLISTLRTSKSPHLVLDTQRPLKNTI